MTAHIPQAELDARLDRLPPEARPEYLANLEQLIVSRNADGFTIDKSHPTWALMHARYKEARAVTVLAGKTKRPLLAFGPGRVVGAVLKRLGFTCTGGCRWFAEKMNRWGWLGCYRNRAEIVDWFCAQARRAGIEVSREDVWPLVWAGIKDVWKRRGRVSPPPSAPPA